MLSLVTTLGRTAFQAGRMVGNVVSAHSPEIMVGAGLVGGAVTTVAACKATVKIVDISITNNQLREKVDQAEQIMDMREADQFEDVDGKVYTREDVAMDRKALKVQTTVAYLKAYGPVAALGVASAVSILCGFNILNRRNMMLVAAYTSLERSFNIYRKRVIADIGPEADWRYRTGAVLEKHEENIIDSETGEVKTKKVKGEYIPDVEEPMVIDYTINLGRECKAPFIKDAIDYTRTYSFLDMIATSATNDLQTFGWMSLNDIRRELYCPPVAIGQVAGWSRDGDGYIDFRAREVYDEQLGKNTIILDPNVDGAILDTIKELEEENAE